MSSKVIVYIKDEGMPANIPDYETIITRSLKERPSQINAINITGVRIDIDKIFDLDVSSIWVKFGHDINMGEAKTQHFVSQHLQAHKISVVRCPRVYLAFTCGALGFIVSEYIDGRTCDYSDVDRVAAAVQALINIPSPGSIPGPVGGGRIEHPFFDERKSCIYYESIEELQDHVNGILSVSEREQRVNFANEGADYDYGLRLCVSDLAPANFMKDRDDSIVAVDFGGYSFLPPSFFAFVLKHALYSNFSLGVAQKLGGWSSPSSSNTAALAIASYALVPYSSNNVGLPKRLRSRIRPANGAQQEFIA